MNDFCSQKGIKREFSNASTPHQNGVAERRNRTLIEAARTMLADAKLPVTFWAEVVNTACYVQNRVLVNKSQNKTPYELFNSRILAIGFLKPFGCIKDAASQEVKKDVSSLRYIVLLNWAHDDLLEFSSTDQMETLTVESPIPTYRSPVLTACLNDSQEPSSKARLISKRVANQEETPSLYNILSLINRFEDTLRVTTSSDETIRVEANNLRRSLMLSKTQAGWNLCRKSFFNSKSRMSRLWLIDLKGSDPLGQNGFSRIKGMKRELLSEIRPVYQMDVKSAFLYGTIDEEVYVIQPPGFQDPAFPTKGEFNSDFHPMVDFIAASPLRIETTDEGTYILATVDGIQRTVSESSLRHNLKLRDEDGIVSIPDTELFENLTLMGYNISQIQKGQFSHQWKYLIHTIMQCLSPKSTAFNEFSSNIATALVCLATNRTYNFSKMIFDGMVKNVNNKISKFLMYPSPSFSGRIVPLFDTMLVHQGEGSGTPTEPHHIPFPEADTYHPTTSSILLPSIPTAPIPPDRETIAKSSTLPHDSSPRVTSPATDEGKEEIVRFKERVQVLEDKEGVATKQSGDDAPINGRSINEGKAATEIISNDSEEIARVLTSIDAATVLAGGIDVPTGSGSIPTAGPPTTVIFNGSEVGPTASPIATRRKGKEVMDNYSKVYKFQSQQRRPMTKKQKREYYMAMIKNNLGWRVKDFRGGNGKAKEERSKLRAGVNLLKQLDREDLNQLWALVKEYLSIRPATSEKEMELWVELKRMYKPDPEDQLWTLTQNFMHAPVE
nr:ribonuclease H-like domain-containing protein [Tanacetum cinerariifolium]